jgi:hypothetical protein
MMDQEFDKVKDACDAVEINTTAAREHIGEIERFIRTIKERSRALMSDLPYTPLPCQVAIHLVYFAVLWLNSLLAAAGVSDKYSPWEIVLGRKINFKKHCKATFSSYAKAHNDPTITNTMRPRTFPRIFLGLTGNRQGTHKVFDINTGIVKKNRTITPLPMPDRVITAIKDWRRHHQKEDKASTLEFLNQKQQQYDWDNNDLKYDEGLIKLDIAHPNIPAEFPGIDLESEQPRHHQVVEVIEESKDKCIYAVQCNASLDNLPHKPTGVSTAVVKIEDNWTDLPEEDDIYNNLPTQPTIIVSPTPILDEDIADNETVNTKAGKLEEAILGSTTIDRRRCSTHNRIPTRVTKVSFNNKTYSDGQYKDGTIHITVDSGHDANHPSPINPNPLTHIQGIAMLHYTNPKASAVVFAQSYSFKAGLKKFGKVGETATVTELTQLHTYETYHPVHTKLLSPKERLQALLSLMNIVEKRNGQVHARAVADGSKERTQPGYKKEDGASPTVATNSIMITTAINAHEQPNVATIDIPGAFLHAYNNKETFMLLKGHLAKLMVQVDPQLYRKLIIYDKNNQALFYVKLSKAIYGLLKSTLFFYKKFVEDLKNYKSPFTINPYDPCVANATINGKQMIITWHIDDLKVSHVDPFQRTKFAAYLATIHGNSLVVH